MQDMSRLSTFIVGGIALTALTLYCCVLGAKLEASQERLKSYERSYFEALDTIKTQEESYKKTLSVIQALRSAELERSVLSYSIIKDVDNASDSEDGPVSPVLRNTLDRLRGKTD